LAPENPAGLGVGSFHLTPGGRFTRNCSFIDFYALNSAGIAGNSIRVGLTLGFNSTQVPVPQMHPDGCGRQLLHWEHLGKQDRAGRENALNWMTTWKTLVNRAPKGGCGGKC